MSAGHVYIIQGVGQIKIGRTATPRRRLEGIRTAAGLTNFRCWVSTAHSGYEKNELALHAAFAQYRRSGEWFRVRAEVAVQAAARLGLRMLDGPAAAAAGLAPRPAKDAFRRTAQSRAGKRTQAGRHRYSLADAAILLSLTEKALRARIASGELKALCVDGKTCIAAHAMSAYVARLDAEAASSSGAPA